MFLLQMRKSLCWLFQCILRRINLSEHTFESFFFFKLLNFLEKFKNLNTAEIVEEDEETFLKGSCQDVSGLRQAQGTQDNVSAFIDDNLRSGKFGPIQGAGESDAEVHEQRKDSCQSSEPFKENLPPMFPADWNSPSCPKFYPLDQLNWEDRIIWDASPARSHSTEESCEISGFDSDAVGDKHLETGTHPLMSDLESEHYQHDEHSFCHGFAISTEPFGSRSPSGPSKLPYPKRLYHPQLLRLESRYDQDNPNNTNIGNEGGSEEILVSDAIRRFNRLTLQNRDLLEGSWLDNVIWDPNQSISKPKLIFDFRDEQMLFEIQDSKDGKHLRLHAGAMVITRSVKGSTGDSVELHSHAGPSVGRFNISNDKFYSNRKSSQQVKSHMKKRTAHGLKVLHSIPALKLQTMKAKLSK